MKPPPAVCPYCDLAIDVPVAPVGKQDVDGRTVVTFDFNDVEWHMHLQIEHPDKPLARPWVRPK